MLAPVPKVGQAYQEYLAIISRCLWTSDEILFFLMLAVIMEGDDRTLVLFQMFMERREVKV